MDGKAMEALQCRGTRAKFSEQEDQQLCSLVEQFGDSNWPTVASFMRGRSVRQCRDRWHHYLAPACSAAEWTPEEDRLLVDRIRIVGKQWAKLTPIFPGRTGIAIRNHCCKLARQKSADPVLRSLVFDDMRKKVKTDLIDANQIISHEPDPSTGRLPSCATLMAEVSAAPDATRLYPLVPRARGKRA
jgi:hypothetical protein